MERNTALFIIFFTIGIAFCWGVIAFISLDALWFWNTWIGRIVAVFVFAGVLKAALKGAKDDESMPD